MQNILLVVHLLLTLALIGVVLLQRSEGGGLGIGGGNAATGRAPSTPLGKLTWIIAIGFLCTSIALTILAAANNSGTSVIDGATTETDGQTPPIPGLDGNLLPPSPADEPAVPPTPEN